MSVSIANLFNYSRALPEPFDSLTSKKVKVASKYASGTEATLCGSVIKAVHAFYHCATNGGEGAVGWVENKKCVQEPSTIMQPGVLVGLNSLLEQDGTITLPTGEIIKRHPDAVVIVTTNVSYEGCRGMNQSVTDRMSLVKDVELPPPEVMVQRVMAVTGATDEYQVSQMVQVVNDMTDYCRKNSITDGSCGMRSLIDWVISTEISGDPYESALYTIISKATADEEDREALISTILEPIFAPKRKSATA